MDSASLRKASTELQHNFLERPQRLLIDGRWCPAESGQTLDVINPAKAR